MIAPVCVSMAPVCPCPSPSLQGHAWLQTQNWAKISKILDNIYDHLAGLRITTVGMIGFCWGVW